MAGGVNNNKKIDIAALQKLMQGNEIQKSDLGSNSQLNSVFEQCDTSPKDGKLSKNELTNFRSFIKGMINNIMASKKNQTNKVEPNQTDVTNLTNQESKDTQSPKFDEKGNYLSDVTNNKDGSKTIKSGDETLSVGADGKSLSVKAEDGNETGLVKTQKGYELTETGPNGEKIIHLFDKNKNYIGEKSIA